VTAVSVGQRRPSRRLGDVLLAAGLIRPEDLEEALRRQKESGRRLGEVLVEMGVLGAMDIAEILAEQLGLPFLYGAFPVDPEVARQVPEGTCRRLEAIPVRREGMAVVVAMADPLDMLALNELQLATRSEVLPAVATPQDIERAIERAFRHGADARDLESDSWAVRTVQEIIERGVRERASDIHFEPQEDALRVRMRVDGLLVEVERMPKAVEAALLSRVKVLSNLDISERRLPQDGRVEVRVAGRPIDLRVATMPTIHGEKAVLRLLDRGEGLKPLEELGLSSEDLARLRALIRRPYGLLLVTGPTGSGKTTTLMTCLKEINAVERNVITIEDPVEYTLPGVNQTQVHPRIGLTFAEGLRAILRQDPDVVMVGEIRDRETAEIAVRAALTGHLVLSTVHTNSAAATPARLLDMGVEPYLVAASLIGVVSQRLARRLCVRCRRPRAVAPEEVRLGVPEDAQLYEPVGCPHCNGLGFRGRIGLFEVLVSGAELKEQILAKASQQALAVTAVKTGMRPLLVDGVAKALAGITSLEEVLRVAFQEEGS
jgi:type IV pilus assembly protein PilB